MQEELGNSASPEETKVSVDVIRCLEKAYGDPEMEINVWPVEDGKIRVRIGIIGASAAPDLIGDPKKLLEAFQNYEKTSDIKAENAKGIVQKLFDAGFVEE